MAGQHLALLPQRLHWEPLPLAIHRHFWRPIPFLAWVQELSSALGGQMRQVEGRTCLPWWANGRITRKLESQDEQTDGRQARRYRQDRCWRGLQSQDLRHWACYPG